MSESLGQSPENAEEFSRERALSGLIHEYFPEDEEFFGEMDFEDRLGAVYGQLLESGEDPDLVLGEAGVLEDDENEV
ncbi:MAG TPA: hypothetical protein VFG56_00185 [Candidatus Saccharimonadales bacterium]|nr:hypothetical protein [Candidatus Saccharimonadales bacterium]